MASEKEIIVAFLFKQSGKEKMSFSDLYLTLSMKLNWCTPEQAKIFVDTSIRDKLIVKKDELIKPNFDTSKINVPLGFVPSKKVFEKIQTKEKECDALKEMVEKIAERANIEENALVEKIKKIGIEKNITTEVAALLVGKEYDIVLNDFYEEVAKRIRENKG